MAEAPVEFPEREKTGISTTLSGSAVVRIPKVRPPEKKKYEEEMEALTNTIKGKETQLKVLNQRAEDGPQIELHSLRIDKDSTIGRRKKIDNSLRNINQEIAKQMASLNTLQATLQYKNEDRINEVIRRLEHQLKTNNFSLRDEKKIVADIDRLKRSRHSLVQYNALKKEIDGMRDKQRRMREERDHLFKKVSALKSTEDGIKKSYAATKERIDKLKKEIDDLKAQKSTLFMDFKNQEEEYRQSRDAYRKMKNTEYKQKKEEERRIQMEAYQKELEEYEASREPYEDEKLLCTTLITYLQKFLLTDGESQNSSQDLSASGGSTISTEGSKEESTGDQPSGMYVLKKKNEDDSMFSGIVRPKTNKRSKRDKRKSLVRPIVHTPQIFSQFASLHLSAPPNITEVASAIEQLQAKKKYYENLPPPNPSIMVDSNQGGSTSDGSAGAPSVAESAICESIPSTPETMLDNAPPRFPGIRGDDGRGDDTSLGGWPRLRKLSKDSGTELEEPNTSSCDELTPHGGDDIAKTLSPGLDPATSKLSEQTYTLGSAPSSVISAPKITEMQPSVTLGFGGIHGGGSDVTNSSSSITPTNSIDNLEPLCNNNNSSVTSVNGNCQNQNTDSNSNPDVRSNNHDDIVVNSAVVPSQGWDVEEEMKNAEKLQAVFTNLASAPVTTESDKNNLTAIPNSAVVDANLESPTQEVLVIDGTNTS